MSGQGIAQILVYAVVLIGSRTRSASTWPGCTRALPRAAGSPPSRAASTASSAPTRSGTGLEELREDGRSCSRSSSSACSYPIQRLQDHLFLNPDHLPAVPSHIALNTTASFVTNTNWQYYGGEYTMSYLSQMAGLAVQHSSRRRSEWPCWPLAVIRGFGASIGEASSETSGSTSTARGLRPAAAVADPRADPALPGRAADLRRARDRAHAPGCRTDDRARPGRV